eukprot:XP_001694938.1 predicted protein [Chlamydomonas reinhardtii]
MGSSWFSWCWWVACPTRGSGAGCGCHRQAGPHTWGRVHRHVRLSCTTPAADTRGNTMPVWRVVVGWLGLTAMSQL